MTEVVKYIAFLSPPEPPEGHAIRNTCYLCGSNTDLSIDHVIPKVLFKPSTTNNYIKLWACKKCNKLKGKEDEYITRCLQSTSFIETAKKGFAGAVRGFVNGHGIGIGRGILDNISKCEIETKHGKFSEVLKLDKNRFNDYLKIIAKGLIVRNTLELYDWEEYEFHCGIDQAILDMKLRDEEPFKTIWEKAKLGEYWQHIFTYRGEVIGSKMIWVMCFYSSFFASVGINKKSINKSQ